MIRVDNLRKQFGDKVAVDDLSFVVKTGKVTGFLGPNGSGKSTTMRLMLGLATGEGQTVFDNRALQNHASIAKTVGFLLEAKAYQPTRSARNHLQILAVQSGIAKRRVDEVLDIVGLSDVAEDSPNTFSLGMSQRLGIAAAIIGEPKHLLLDEPANGLDPEGIAWLRVFLKAYAAQGNTVFVSSHLLSEMAQVADDLVVIGKGRLVAATSTKEFIRSSSHTSIFVRSNDNTALGHALTRQSFIFAEKDGGLAVQAASTDEVGKLACDSGITVLELTQHLASLEEAFLERTADVEEYKGTVKEGHTS